MRIRNLVVAAAVVAALPVAAHADDTLTAITADTPTAVVAAAPSVDPAEQAHLRALIARRVGNVDAPEKSGFIAVNPDGSPVWATRADVPLMPASTMKVVTATVALHVLGPRWRPTTTVTYDTATRTLALVGGGDPLLTTEQLETLAQNAIDSITATAEQPARLVVDDSLFPAPVRQAGVSAGQLPSEERPVRALVVDRRKSSDSALDAGRTFRRILAGKGVLVPFAGRALSSGMPVAAVRGFQLQSSLRTMLVYSDNDIAEMTFRLSAIGAGRSATWAQARATAYRTLAALGAPTARVQLVDGSGLSRNNRLTPFSLAELLRIAESDSRTKVLHALLPKAGVEGTLRKRYASGPATCVQGQLQAKTGSLHDVIALAGYAPAQDGTARPFAMIVNDVRNSPVARNRTRAQLDSLAAAFSGC